jgi:hypothetical protein
MPARFSPLSSAAFCPTERATASVSTSRIAVYSAFICSSVIFPVSAKGDILATCRISSEYALPIPASTSWSTRTPLIWPLRERMRSANSGLGDGQRVRPEPGHAGHLGRVAHQIGGQRLLRAGLGQVEAGAVVEPHPQRDRPAARLERRRRLERVAVVQPAGPGEVNDQVQVVAEADIQEFPCRPASRTVIPATAEAGGSYVFSALNEDTSRRCTVWPTARSRR